MPKDLNEVPLEVIVGSHPEGDPHTFRFDQSNLLDFLEKLLSGTPLPLKFCVGGISDLSTFLATSLFLHRDIAIHPKVFSLVYLVELSRDKNKYLLSHFEKEVTDFLLFLERYIILEAACISKNELGERLPVAISWLRDYILQSQLPNFGNVQDTTKIIDVGTNGFVLAETTSPCLQPSLNQYCLEWFNLFRLGYLRGVLITPDHRGRRQVVACRKTDQIQFDTKRASLLLTELELALGGDDSWDHDDLHVRSPEKGTVISVGHMLEVFTRV